MKLTFFENEELIHGMQRELQPYEKKEGMDSLVKAGHYLHSALQILEETGFTTQANRVLDILLKIAQNKDEQNSKNIKDRHISGLTSDKMVKNLLEHGTVFNMTDDNNKSDDLLNLDINEAQLEVVEDNPTLKETFEDGD